MVTPAMPLDKSHEGVYQIIYEPQKYTRLWVLARDDNARF
jgi:hypothetical protein